MLIDIDLANISGYGTTLVAGAAPWWPEFVKFNQYSLKVLALLVFGRIVEFNEFRPPGGGTGHQGGSISRNVHKVNIYTYAYYDICFQKCMIFY